MNERGRGGGEELEAPSSQALGAASDGVSLFWDPGQGSAWYMVGPSYLRPTASVARQTQPPQALGLREAQWGKA